MAEALVEFGQPADVVLPKLIDVVRDSEWGARAEAFYLLQRIGPFASRAVATVSEAMKDDDENVRALADETLQYMSHEPGPADTSSKDS